MKIFKLISIWGFILFSAIAIANHSQQAEKTEFVDCTIPTKFVTYKDGMKAHHNNDFNSAFNIFCSLALQGDDRAQFRIAEYYSGLYSTTTPTDLNLAYIWSRLANAYIHTTKRTNFYEHIKSQFNDKDLEQAQLDFSEVSRFVRTGNRIDQKHEKLDLARIFKKYHDKINNQVHTGSRIRGRKISGPLGAMQVN